MPRLITWHTFQMIVDYLLLLWMLMFWTSLITICYCLVHCSLPLPCALNVRKKLQNQIVNLIDNLWDCFCVVFVCYQYQEGSLWCFGIFLFFFKIIKKSHKMSCLMLDLEFKSLYLIYFYWLWIRCEHCWKI